MTPRDATASTLDPIADDLRTVLALVAGARVGADRCRQWVDEVMDGADTPAHEAVVYLLATHLLALGDRPALDRLAWRWLSRRHPKQPWTARSASDGLRLAVFAVESGWQPELMRRLLVLIAQSRSLPLWVNLSDLARTGARHAERLLPVIEAVDLFEADHATRRAAFLMLSQVHELHRCHAEVGPDWVIVVNSAPDCRVATVFTDRAHLPAEARLALQTACAKHHLLTALHSHRGGVERLASWADTRRVVPLGRTYPDDHRSAVAHAHEVEGPANHPGLMGLSPERILGVFPSGPAVAREGRWWLVPSGGAVRAGRVRSPR